jgi:hypothetical protein
MTGVSEWEVFAALRKCAGESSSFLVGEETPVRVKLEPMDLHVGDSPDCVLWVTVELRVFQQDVRLRVPVLVEAEKAGLKAAREDLEKFSSRGNHPLEVPMLVVSEAGYLSQEERVQLATRVRIRQLPVALIRRNTKSRTADGETKPPGVL